MMRYEENEKLADNSACAGVRADLKMCLLESDCCKKVTQRPQCNKNVSGIVCFYFRTKEHHENVCNPI